MTGDTEGDPVDLDGLVSGDTEGDPVDIDGLVSGGVTGEREGGRLDGCVLFGGGGV